MKKLFYFLVLFGVSISTRSQRMPQPSSYESNLGAGYDSFNYVIMHWLIKDDLVPLLLNKYINKDTIFEMGDNIISMQLIYINDSVWRLDLCQQAVDPQKGSSFEEIWEDYWVNKVSKTLIVSSDIRYDYFYEEKFGFCGYNRGGNIGLKHSGLRFLFDVSRYLKKQQ